MYNFTAITKLGKLTAQFIHIFICTLFGQKNMCLFHVTQQSDNVNDYKLKNLFEGVLHILFIKNTYKIKCFLFSQLIL